MTPTEYRLLMQLELAVGMLTMLREGKTFDADGWDVRMQGFQRAIDHTHEHATPPYPRQPPRRPK